MTKKEMKIRTQIAQTQRYRAFLEGEAANKDNAPSLRYLLKEFADIISMHIKSLEMTL